MRDTMRSMRPAGGAKPYAVRFETPPGHQAQVDFAQFRVRFADAPDGVQVVWLFSMILGFSRLIWGRFVLRQTMPSVLACHRAAVETIGGVPREILYDRIKTAVIGEDEGGRVVYNRTLREFAEHYSYLPKACRAYRPETKGKVERPFRYIREDFFLGGVFRDLDDLNAQFNRGMSTVANPRLHATTGRVVNHAFAEEMSALQPLPLVPFGAVLKLERWISHGGMVSIGGNCYSIPDATRRLVVEVHSLADEIMIFKDDRLIARNPVLEGRRQQSLLDGHRRHRRKNDDLASREIKPVIPGRSNPRMTIQDDRALQKQRNRIDRMLGHLKINRAIATRYDQLDETFLGVVHNASARYWLKFVHAAIVSIPSSHPLVAAL